MNGQDTLHKGEIISYVGDDRVEVRCDIRSRDRDRTMITNYKAWPWFPYLPLKRGAGKHIELGLLLYECVTREVKPIVLLANLFFPEDEKKLCNKLHYQNFDDILDDGWVVD